MWVCVYLAPLCVCSHLCWPPTFVRVICSADYKWMFIFFHFYFYWGVYIYIFFFLDSKLICESLSCAHFSVCRVARSAEITVFFSVLRVSVVILNRTTSWGIKSNLLFIFYNSCRVNKPSGWLTACFHLEKGNDKSQTEVQTPNSAFVLLNSVYNIWSEVCRHPWSHPHAVL